MNALPGMCGSHGSSQGFVKIHTRMLAVGVVTRYNSNESSNMSRTLDMEDDMRLLDEAVAKIKEAQVFMDDKNLIELDEEVIDRLNVILELAQGHSGEEVSYSDVVCLLLRLAQANHTNTELGTLVYEETV